MEEEEQKYVHIVYIKEATIDLNYNWIEAINTKAMKTTEITTTTIEQQSLRCIQQQNGDLTQMDKQAGKRSIKTTLLCRRLVYTYIHIWLDK